jgi:hypothetical protein
MILDSVLLSIAKLSPSKYGVAILPEWRLASGEGVVIRNPVSSYEVTLTGTVDYGIIQYERNDNNRGQWRLAACGVLLICQKIDYLVPTTRGTMC